MSSKTQDFWRFILEKLNNDISVILLVVIENKGSSPGKPGFKMAVAGDDTMKGSVGGGVSEYRLVELAKKELKKETPEISIKREVHQPDAETDKSGMICSGEQWVAFYPIRKNKPVVVNNIISAIESGKKGIIRFTQNGFDFNLTGHQQNKPVNPVISSNEWKFTEETGNQNHLYIIGAGHVGLALSRVMNSLDFIIHLFDSRKDLNTFQENNEENHYRIINYKDIGSLVPESDKTYVVIMTFGHSNDELILKQLINKNIKYLGMMGSNKKVETVFKDLENKGFKKERLQKVHAPIGLEIASRTPAEIAISIAAQLIAVKNN